jgi:hypothetical protein
MKKLVSRKLESNDTKASTQESFNVQEQYLPNDSVVHTKMIVLGIYLLVIFALVLTLILLICTF